MNPSIHSIVLEGYVSYKNLRKNHQLCIRVIIYIFLIEERNHKLFFRVMITQEKSAVFEWLLPVILSGPQMMLSSGLSSTSSDLCVRHYNYFYTPPQNQKKLFERKIGFTKNFNAHCPKRMARFPVALGPDILCPHKLWEKISGNSALCIYDDIVPVPCSGTKNQRQSTKCTVGLI